MRLIIVSNRLPITVKESGGKLLFKESVGGLVTGIKSYLEAKKSADLTQPPTIKTNLLRSSHIEGKEKYLWVGWPGIDVSDNLQPVLRKKAMNEYNYLPVFLSEKAMDKFYQGFCNKTIWPLFHYFPSYAVYDETFWHQYHEVNQKFAQTLIKIIKPGDLVWVHDYHLMLLPKMLKEKIRSLPVGFFLHIPFPTCEIFRLLPKKWRFEILQGMLGADLVGFHTYEYTQYFLHCVLRILGRDHTLGRVMLEDRVVKVDTYPIGIDFQKFFRAAEYPEVNKEKLKLRKTLSSFKVILSIDRLDYTKGIINRLLGYELFLQKNPEWHKKVILVMIVVPSRIGVEHYRLMKRQIDELTGKINGRFGTINWTPIIYQYRSLSFEPLTALYQSSDIALITPLRDGMNLIAKEYIASRTDQTGVLILSEMAGASKELGEAIIINPNNTAEISDSLKQALTISRQKQIQRNQIMQKRLKRYNIVKWANDFIEDLKLSKKEQQHYRAKVLTAENVTQLTKDYKKSRRRLILLDYDGTLVPFAERPELAKPAENVIRILKKLAQSKDAEIVLISGRDKKTLENWFAGININLVAEHGSWVKEKNHSWKTTKILTGEWKRLIRPILEWYVDRVPGAFIEEKEFSLVWHYRKCDPESASARAKEIIDNILNIAQNIDIQVLQGSKVVEVKSGSVNKGTATMYFMSKKRYGFILAIGDDSTDEEIFKVLPEKAYSIRVGIVSSKARYNVYNYNDVLKLVSKIVKLQ